MACHIALSPYKEGVGPCETYCESSSIGEEQVAWLQD